DPYPQTTNVDPDFPDMWCAALSHAMSRFEGCRALYANARSGGVGAFTADNFPVFDYLKPNVYAVLDSNHGYKMIGVGREVVKVLASLGVEVVVLPATDGLVDGCFVYDPVFVTGAGQIVLQMCKPARVDEPERLATALEDAGVPVAGRLDGGAYADGGDMFW